MPRADTGKVTAGGLRDCHKNLGGFLKTQDPCAGGGAFVPTCRHIVSINAFLFLRNFLLILEEFPHIVTLAFPDRSLACGRGGMHQTHPRYHEQYDESSSKGTRAGGSV